MTQQYRLASTDAQLFSTGISHHSLLPHISSVRLSTVNSSPRNPSTPDPSHCTFLGTSIPVRGLYGCDKNCLILIPFRLPQISCFILNLQCFSSDSDDCPDVGIGPLLQFPHPPRAGPVLLTLLFFPLVPSSYQISCGSIYSFSLVRYSCPLSAVVLHIFLCPKVYS